MIDASKRSGFWAGLREIIILLLIVFVIRTFGFGLYQVPTGSMETTMLVGERFFADKFTPIFSSIDRGDIVAFNDPTFQFSSNPLMSLFQNYVWGPSNWTKRIIGLPGERVRGIIENGKPVVYINDKKLDEPYVNQYPLIQVCPYEIDTIPEDRKTVFYDYLLRNASIGIPLIAKSYDPSISFENQVFYRMNKDKVLRTSSGPLLIDSHTPLRSRDGSANIPDVFDVTLSKNQYWVMGDNRLGSHDSRWWGPLEGKLVHGRIMYRIWSVDSDENWWILDCIKHPINFWQRVRWGRFFQRVK